MRLYVLELKRLLKTRSVGILIIAALILSAVLSYLPVTYIQAYKTDKSGTIQVVTGIEAIKAKKSRLKKALHGEMTEAKIRETIADIKEVLKEYGSLERQNIPLDVYVKKVYSHLDINCSTGTDDYSKWKEPVYIGVFIYQLKMIEECIYCIPGKCSESE